MQITAIPTTVFRKEKRKRMVNFNNILIKEISPYLLKNVFYIIVNQV